MLRDARDLAPDVVLSADVCIAGAGPAGITMARDLKGSGQRVLLLESGGLEHENRADDLNEGVAVGMPERRLTRCRARQFGGASAKWAGWCRPLDPEDFEARDWIPMSGWPISRADLDPYYRKAQRTCQIGAFEYDADALTSRLGRRGLPFVGGVAGSVAYQFSPPTRFGQVYRRDIEQASDVTAYLHANLVDIELSERGAAVSGLWCLTSDGVRFRVEADQYALALGGIENARMLLASRGQEPDGVGNRNDQVGRYFMEHPHFYAGAFLLAANPASLAPYVGRYEALTVDAGPGGPAIEQPAIVGLALALSADTRASERLQGLAATVREEAPEADTDLLPARNVARLLGTSTSASLFRLDIRCEQQPNPRSRVTLDEERGPLGIPRVRVTWDLEPADLESVRRTLEVFGTEFGRAELGRMWIPERDGVYDPPAIGAGCHHMGTTRMGNHPDDSVVDADCRVHGLDNLFVAGSSVFASGGFSNPTLTIVALAHRLAEHIAGAR